MSVQVKPGTEWVAGHYRVRVLRVQRNGRIAFERVEGGPVGKEVRCDAAQFLMAYSPAASSEERP
jgi:hypothetical protein